MSKNFDFRSDFNSEWVNPASSQLLHKQMPAKINVKEDKTIYLSSLDIQANRELFNNARTSIESGLRF